MGRLIKQFKITDGEIVSLYNNGTSMKDIAKIATDSIGCMSIRRRLISLGINTSKTNRSKYYKEKISKSKRKYTLKEDYFSNIDTQEKAYILGLLYSDGYNRQDRNYIELTLQSQDKYILEKISQITGSNRPVFDYKSNASTLLLNSLQLSKDLAILGCVQNKHDKIKFPTLRKDLISHFIRGYFDGDGSISVTGRSDRPSLSYQISFTSSSKDFIDSIQNKLVESCSINKTKYFIKENNNKKIYSLIYGGRVNCLKILNYLYKDAALKLERKYSKYIKMCVLT